MSLALIQPAGGTRLGEEVGDLIIIAAILVGVGSYLYFFLALFYLSIWPTILGKMFNNAQNQALLERQSKFLFWYVQTPAFGLLLLGNLIP